MKLFSTIAWAGVLTMTTLAMYAGELTVASPGEANAFPLAGRNGAASIVIDSNDYTVVTLAAGFLADDVQRQLMAIQEKWANKLGS